MEAASLRNSARPQFVIRSCHHALVVQADPQMRRATHHCRRAAEMIPTDPCIDEIEGIVPIPMRLDERRIGMTRAIRTDEVRPVTDNIDLWVLPRRLQLPHALLRRDPVVRVEV